MKSTVSQCPIEDAMVLLSGRWPTLLLYYLQQGTKRFSELQRDNPTISHRILTLELRKLERAGIVRRIAYGGYPSRVEYALTPAGGKLIPLIDALGDWWSETQAERAATPGEARLAGNLAAGKLPAGAISNNHKGG
jgi:DNA-binding HxlR family transcriptional regulator